MDTMFDGLGRKVELRPIDEVKTYRANTRRHSPKQVKKLAAQMQANRWTNPGLVDEEGNLLAGHGRKLAAEYLNLTHFPVIVISGLTQAQKRAVMMADNRLHDESSFDKQALKVELEALSLEGFNLELTGFNTLEIDKLLTLDALDPKENEERVNLPSKKAKAIARLGDLWQIGLHRLVVTGTLSWTSTSRACG